MMWLNHMTQLGRDGLDLNRFPWAPSLELLALHSRSKEEGLAAGFRAGRHLSKGTRGPAL